MSKAKYTPTAQRLINALQSVEGMQGVGIIIDNASLPRICNKMPDWEFAMFQFYSAGENHKITLKDTP